MTAVDNITVRIGIWSRLEDIRYIDNEPVSLITNFFIPELNNHDVQELWFQQDGATCHTARATNDLLKDAFGDRLISRFGPVNWPPRSSDLTPLDYFSWGYVKSLIYADKLQTLDHLEDNIRRVIAVTATNVGKSHRKLDVQFHAKNLEVEIDGVTINRPFGEFLRANSYCYRMVLKIQANDRHTSSPLPR
ncbi:putative DD41D transposase [Trichonephila clavipes]|nr:putative DD41D transposase [Trichonephila clavipes]